MAKYKESANEAAWNLSNSVREANQAITDSATAAQERNMKFAQSILDRKSTRLNSSHRL